MPTEDASALALRAARLLIDQKEQLGLPDLRIVTQEEFLRDAAQHVSMPVEEKRALLDQTERVLKDLYAHLPFKPVFKSEDPNVNPFIGFAALREQLDTLNDFDFHTCMLIALSAARDIHTSYTAPSPYGGAVAFLPFQLRFYEQPKGTFRFVVAKTMATSEKGEFEHPYFRVGSEILHWNGLNMMDAGMVAAQLQPGANPDAELSRGTARMTIRSIGSHSVASAGGLPPFQAENFVSVQYLAPGAKKKREIMFPWQVVTGFGSTPFSSTAFSHSDAMASMQRWAKCSYRPDKVTANASGEPDFFEARFPSDPPAPNMPDPELLSNPRYPGWPFGYLRIRNFASDTPSILEDASFKEMKEVLARFDREACGGLILDIRGNPGGQIRLAERILQLLSPREIKPLRFHFPRTPLVKQIIESLRTTGAPSTEFAAWLEPHPDDDLSEDALLTPGRTITPAARANDTGQVYQGPVVLLFDALTYSAADMFAAGFQDHEIGELIGVDCSTGGGGANAWSYNDILDNVPAIAGIIDLPKLPRDCKLSVAVRRCTRVGPEQLAIEEIGVAPNFLHARTRRDVLEGNPDLFRFACERLSTAPICRFDIEKTEREPGALNVTLTTIGMGFVVFRSGSQILASSRVSEGEPHIFRLAIADGKAGPDQIRIEGYRNAEELEKQLPALAAPRLLVHNPEGATKFSRTSLLEPGRLGLDRRAARQSGR
jgi:hypothetical protein